jgi:hypothetical protein
MAEKIRYLITCYHIFVVVENFTHSPLHCVNDLGKLRNTSLYLFSKQDFLAIPLKQKIISNSWCTEFTVQYIAEDPGS